MSSEFIVGGRPGACHCKPATAVFKWRRARGESKVGQTAKAIRGETWLLLASGTEGLEKSFCP